MAVVRGNIVSSAHTQTFLEGLLDLSGRSTGIAPVELNQSVPAAAPEARLFGTAAELNRPLSWWDLFAWWHVTAMSWPTGGSSNRAHRGPVFLPWHRLYLRRLEEAIQTVTGEDAFALPYWDWSEDGELPRDAQRAAPLWSILGPSRGQITQGPLAEFRVRLFQNAADQRLYAGPPRPAPSGVTPAEEYPACPIAPTGSGRSPTACSTRPGGTRPPTASATSSRASRTPAKAAHAPARSCTTACTLWAGGDMAPGSSPNDPLFWLNHCNVDRIWEAWMQRRGRTYVPGPGQGPPGHRANDALFSIVWDSMTPNQVLDVTESGLDWYRYDALPT